MWLSLENRIVLYVAQARRITRSLVRQMMLGAPLRARTAHVVQLGAVGVGDNSKEGTVAGDDRAEALGERHGEAQCSLPSAAAKGMTKSSLPSSSVTRSSQPRQSSELGVIIAACTKRSACAQASESELTAVPRLSIRR